MSKDCEHDYGKETEEDYAFEGEYGEDAPDVLELQCIKCGEVKHIIY